MADEMAKALCAEYRRRTGASPHWNNANQRAWEMVAAEAEDCVHEFLGVGKGRELKRGAVATAVAELKRYCWRRCPTEYCAERVENCGVNVALLALGGGDDAAGEEVE